ncbi:hypothetical protein PSCICN_22510 [Pseudomonas cichorii]|nr:hypothetical protein PSCICN_22510 [Pseudomonas cichorii]
MQLFTGSQADDRCPRRFVAKENENASQLFNEFFTFAFKKMAQGHFWIFPRAKKAPLAV